MQLPLFIHECLSIASLSAVPHVSSIYFKSCSKVFLMVIFGLPCFFLPGGFHLTPFLGILMETKHKIILLIMSRKIHRNIFLVCVGRNYIETFFLGGVVFYTPSGPPLIQTLKMYHHHHLKEIIRGARFRAQYFCKWWFKIILMRRYVLKRILIKIYQGRACTLTGTPTIRKFNS